MPIFDAGRRVYELPPLNAIRDRCQDQLARISPHTLRHINPHTYDVGLEQRLHALKLELIAKARSTQ